MVHQLLTALLTLPVILAMDFVWLGFVARPFYQKQIGILMGETKFWAAGVVYLLLALGLILFALPHAKTYPQALLWGGLFGLIGYGIYDFTNLAVLKNWTLTVSLVDMAWGGVVCAVATCAAMFIDKLLR
ncbi:MAG: DUF2177 family protein [Patescibacteria group bacterium]